MDAKSSVGAQPSTELNANTAFARVESQPNPRRARKRLSWTAALLVAGLTGIAIAEQVTVQRNQIDVLKGKSGMYVPPLATKHNGDTLQVIDHEGRWLKVQTQDASGQPITGYVLASSLTGPDVPVTGVDTGTGSQMASAGAAAKGWDSSAWANSHSYSEDGLNAMIATRARISRDPSIWDNFKSDGNVGVH